MQAWAGAALPEQLQIEEHTCCVAAESLACCYAIDVCCTIPVMRSVETGDNRLNLALFAFYEPCWICMGCLRFVCCVPKQTLQQIPRRLGVYTFDPI